MAVPRMGKSSEEVQDYEGKYQEYKTKLASWVNLFEEEYGYRPTEAERAESKTWSALNSKAKFYKKLVHSGGGGSFKRASRESSFKVKELAEGSQTMPARRSQADKERRGHRESSAPPAGRARTRREENPRASRRGHRDRSAPGKRSGKMVDQEEGGGERHHRRGPSGRSSRERHPPAEAGEEGEELPPLPIAGGSLASKSEWVALETKAKEAREKILKWERAFEREQASPPQSRNTHLPLGTGLGSH